MAKPSCSARGDGPETRAFQIVDPLTGKISELPAVSSITLFGFARPFPRRLRKIGRIVWKLTMPGDRRRTAHELSPTLSFSEKLGRHTTLCRPAIPVVFWIPTTGGTSQVLNALDLCGTDFEPTPHPRSEFNPANSDMPGLVSGVPLKHPPAIPRIPNRIWRPIFVSTNCAPSAASPTEHFQSFPTQGEWSRDGLRSSFTSRDSTGKKSIYRIFWDGHRPQEKAARLRLS